MLKLTKLTFILLHCVLLLVIVNSFRTNFHSRNWLTSRANNIFTEIEDKEELTSFKRIVSNYLAAKFRDCRGEDCKFSRDRSEVKELLRVVLPPVSADELAKEVKQVIGKLGEEGEVMQDEYVDAVLQNTFWTDAGPFVVKELIFLDCLQNYYNENINNFLSDEDYDELKGQLAWEGSVAASLSAKEAQFITAVAATARGLSIMDDEEYDVLKNELLVAQSWVVNRGKDPLEKMGVKTFMSYLHRSLD